jgi:CHAT domain-containing protein
LAFLVLGAACRGQQAELTSVRLIAERLHAAYANKDLEGVVSLWNDQSPQKAAQVEAARKLFANAAITAIREATTKDPEQIAEGRIRLRVDRELAGGPGAGKTQLVLEWVRDGSDWKIIKESRAADDLASRLAALPATNKPDALLAANSDVPGADVASALIDQSTDDRNRGNMAVALAKLAVARTIAEHSGAETTRALALNNTGLVYAEHGDYTLALDSYRESLALSEKLHDDRGIARVMVNVSFIYSGIGELNVASEYLEKSLAAGERLQDKRLVVTALGNMAINYARRADYLRALALFQRVQDLVKSSNDTRGLAGNLNNIGNVYLWQGDLNQASDYFGRELEVATSAGLKPLTAVAWMGLGRVAQFRGDFSTAISSFEKCLAVFNETGNKPYAAAVLTFLGNAYSYAGQQAKAVEYFQKGLDLQNAMGAASEAALTLGRIAEVHNRKGDYAAALKTAAEGRKLADSSGVREASWMADLQEGRAQQGLGNNPSADAHFRSAIATIEAIRQDVAGTESERENYFETKLEPYHRLVGLLLAGGRSAEALEFAERAKARVLLDVLNGGKVDLSTVMSADERRREQTYRFRLASLNTQLAQARRANSASQVADVNKTLESARLEYDRFENELYTRHPMWKVQSAAQPVGVDQVRAILPDSNEAFLEYVLAEDEVYVFSASGEGGELKVATLPISRATLTESVNRLQHLVATRNLGYRTVAAALYKSLIAPAGIELAHTRHLVIVPDGVLWELPFQALVNTDGRHLLDSCAISYAPSLTVLKDMIQVKRERIQSAAATRLLAMGNPALGQGIESKVKAFYRDSAPEDLPAAKTEVQNLGRIYGADSRVYVGDQARESRFKSEAGDARVLHLATHAVLNNASPLYSYLLLASDSGSGAEDGLLEARELLTMKLHAELAVLSACETARGRVGAGEGVIGLSWALLVSGVPSTVLSQWKVASDSTSLFMTSFHENRKKHMSDAEALRAAALSLRKNPAYQHPFYWAPFTVIGAPLN